MRRRTAAILTLALAVLALAALPPAPARASLVGTIVKKAGGVGCSIAGNVFEGWTGSICKDGVNLLGSTIGASTAAHALGLAALVTWVLGGARFAMQETASLISSSTTPQLGTAWFSSTYGHVAEIATLLTLPFLFAAAVQALMRSDLAMLARAGFGYLPLAMLAVGIAAPLTALLLSASDEASRLVTASAGGDATSFLTSAGGILGGLTILARSPFVAFLIGFFVAAGALVLWLELLVREVAVYVIVLMLPLVFAAFVWPARRMWAIRAVELLVALILAKFVIVAVLALGAGALHHSVASGSLATLIGGVALVTLAAFSPWALVKLIPLGELATAAAGPLRGELHRASRGGADVAVPWAGAGSDWTGALVTRMQRQAADVDPEGARSADGAQGVTVGDEVDAPLGTAGPPGGPAPGGPGAPELPPGDGGPDLPGAPGGLPGGPGSPGGPDGPLPSASSGTGGPAGPGPGGFGSAAPGYGFAPAAGPADTGRGPRPPFSGLRGAEAEWQRQRDWSTLILGAEGVPPAGERVGGAAADDSDPLPPPQDPESGSL